LAKAFQKISNTPFMNSSSRPTQDQEELIRELQISREKTEIMENALADVAEELEFLKKQVLQPKEPQKEILSMALEDLLEELRFTRWQMESLHNSIDGALTRAFEKDEGFQLKEILVRLMTLALQHWEEATGSSKLELAEKSGIWKVHLDKGYFRVRTLDRYLSVPSLPRYPRWKDVTRTVRFVLNQGTSSVSQELREVLKSFQQQLVRSNS
tara:strand:+ start:2293 stop:2928 length:636 start_codon:yes stop_codon:yes gene_type:complete